MATIRDLRVEAEKGNDLTGEIITVLVGSEEKPFQVHEAVLRSSSAFFDKALKKDWKEGQARKVKLPEDDPAAFHCYIQSIYEGTLACKHESIAKDYQFLTTLYQLGERLLDGVFRDRIINALIMTAREDQSV